MENSDSDGEGTKSIKEDEIPNQFEDIDVQDREPPDAIGSSSRSAARIRIRQH